MGIMMQATLGFRWILREPWVDPDSKEKHYGKKVLQQRWLRYPLNGPSEEIWQDVPIVEEETDG